MEAFDQMWNRSAPAFTSAAAHQRAYKLALASMACLGRHTMSSIICTSGEQFRDWSADYRVCQRERFDRRKLFDVVVDEVQRMVPEHRPFEVALDDTVVKKSGRHVAGARWRADRLGPKFHINFIWGVRFLQLSAVLPDEAKVACGATMVPVELLHCPSPVKPRKGATDEELAQWRELMRRFALPTRGAEALKELRQSVDAERKIICSGDGGYTNRSLLKALPENVAFIGRIRKDAKLFAHPDEQPSRGRPRLYGPQLQTPDAMRLDETMDWQSVEVFVGGRLRRVDVKTAVVRWRPAGAKDLRLLIVRPMKYKLSPNARTLYRNPVYLISTDPDLAIEQVLQSYIRRWGIEQNFRDEKQVLGIGQSYVRSEASVQGLPALIVAAYAMLRLACRQTGQNPSPPPKWYPNCPTKHLSANQEIAILRHALWAPSLQQTQKTFCGFDSNPPSKPKPKKIQNALASAVFYANH